MQLQSTTSKIETLGIEAIFGSTSETSLKYLSGVCWNIGYDCIFLQFHY